MRIKPNSHQFILSAVNPTALVLISLVVGLFLNACSTRSSPTSASMPSKGSSNLETGHWYRIQEEPPIYYPKGISSNHLTGPADGSWVYADDPSDSRYFVPYGGTGTHSEGQLIAGELAGMDTEVMNRHRAKRLRKAKMRAVERAVLIPVGGMLQNFTN